MYRDGKRVVTAKSGSDAAIHRVCGFAARPANPNRSVPASIMPPKVLPPL